MKNLQIIVCFFCFFIKANGAKLKETVSLYIETNDNSGDEKYLLAGTRKTLTCKATSGTQKLEWVDPHGEVVKRISSHRVSASERSRVTVSALVLTFTQLVIEDTGEWTCMSNDMAQSVSLCVIGKVEFVDTPTEIYVDHDRSITLTCQARGNPEPRIVWYRHGEMITDETDPSKYKVMTKYLNQGFEGLLTVMSLKQADTGVYTCEAVQENTLVEDCSATTEINITLFVNHAPFFEKQNVTEIIFGEENDRVELICEARGYPVPVYKWYTDLGDSFSLFRENQIVLQNNGTQAVLTLKVDATTSGHRYQCTASNIHGDAEKYYVIQKIQKPVRPDEISVYDLNADSIHLNLTWHKDIVYVESVDIQYFDAEIVFIKKEMSPTHLDWRKSKQINVEPDKSDMITSDTLVTIPDVESDMVYYIRLRVKNSVGVSTWSESILGATTMLEQNTITVASTYTSMSDTNLYGIICGIVFVIMAAIFVCMRHLSKSS